MYLFTGALRSHSSSSSSWNMSFNSSICFFFLASSQALRPGDRSSTLPAVGRLRARLASDGILGNTTSFRRPPGGYQGLPNLTGTLLSLLKGPRTSGSILIGGRVTLPNMNARLAGRKPACTFTDSSPVGQFGLQGAD